MTFTHTNTDTHTFNHSLIASDCDYTLNNLSQFFVLNLYNFKVKSLEELGINFWFGVYNNKLTDWLQYSNPFSCVHNCEKEAGGGGNVNQLQPRHVTDSI